PRLARRTATGTAASSASAQGCAISRVPALTAASPNAPVEEGPLDEEQEQERRENEGPDLALALGRGVRAGARGGRVGAGCRLAPVGGGGTRCKRRLGRVEHAHAHFARRAARLDPVDP